MHIWSRSCPLATIKYCPRAMSTSVLCQFLYFYIIMGYILLYYSSMRISAQEWKVQQSMTGGGSELHLLLAQSPTVFALTPENTEQCDFVETWHRNGRCCIYALYCNVDMTDFKKYKRNIILLFTHISPCKAVRIHLNSYRASPNHAPVHQRAVKGTNGI